MVHSESNDPIDRWMPAVYAELRALSESFLDRERADHTLQATALVHEAYARLAGGSANFEDRGHFLRVAARTMRRILIDHAAGRRALKRGGGARGLMLEEVTALQMDPDVDLLALDEALDLLAAEDEVKAKIVELKFFGGCTTGEVASALGLSESSVERGWRFARAWLRRRLEGRAPA